MIKKDALLKAGKFIQYRGILLVDHTTWLNLSLEGSFFGSRLHLGCYRKHSGSQSTIHVIESTEKERSFSFEFFGTIKNKSHILKKIHTDPVTLRKKMTCSWSGEITKAHWIKARYLLAIGQKKHSIRILWKGFLAGGIRENIHKKNLFPKTWCLFGIVFVFLGLPLEPIINIFKFRKLSMYQGWEK